MEKTTGIKYSLYEGQDIGEDSGSPIDFTYTPPFKFDGKLRKVTVDLKLTGQSYWSRPMGPAPIIDAKQEYPRSRFATRGTQGPLMRIVMEFQRPLLLESKQTTLSRVIACSCTTSFALLSFLSPRKTGWRNRSSRVHSMNLTWQTNFGFTQ